MLLPYRVPGRPRPAEVIPPPSRRVLLAPLKYAISFGGMCLSGILLWNVTAPLLFGTAISHGGTSTSSKDVRFVPLVEDGQDVVQIAIALSLFVAVFVFIRYVIPRWKGLSLWKKGLYCLGILAAQLSFIAAAEAGAIAARGGLHLFEPHHVSSSSFGPGGQSAHVYKDSFLACRYDVYVAGALSPTMSRELTVNRNDCQEPTPHAKWNADGTVRLVDDSGKALEPQQNHDFDHLLGAIFGGGGC